MVRIESHRKIVLAYWRESESRHCPLNVFSMILKLSVIHPEMAFAIHATDVSTKHRVHFTLVAVSLEAYTESSITAYFKHFTMLCANSYKISIKLIT